MLVILIILGIIGSVLIVAKCIVNLSITVSIFSKIDVLIVAKCIVNYEEARKDPLDYKY